MRDRSVEDLIAVLILIEPEVDERANPTPALRRAVDDRVFDRIPQRIDWTGAGARAFAVALAITATVAAASTVAWAVAGLFLPGNRQVSLLYLMHTFVVDAISCERSRVFESPLYPRIT